MLSEFRPAHTGDYSNICSFRLDAMNIKRFFGVILNTFNRPLPIIYLKPQKFHKEVKNQERLVVIYLNLIKKTLNLYERLIFKL